MVFSQANKLSYGVALTLHPSSAYAMFAFMIGVLIAALLAGATPIVQPGIKSISRADAVCGLPGSESYCAGTNRTTDNRYLCGDHRLGPSKIPGDLPIAALVTDYDPFGGLCPGAFLAKWTDSRTGAYIYPSADGFQVNADNLPMEFNRTLTVGTRLDRFGDDSGRFLTAAFAPYAHRALPPSNLNPEKDGSTFNYHMYEVIQEFVVRSGPIKPWFGQSGNGSQFVTYSQIRNLVKDGFLRRLNASFY